MKNFIPQNFYVNENVVPYENINMDNTGLNPLLEKDNNTKKLEAQKNTPKIKIIFISKSEIDINDAVTYIFGLNINVSKHFDSNDNVSMGSFSVKETLLKFAEISIPVKKGELDGIQYLIDHIEKKWRGTANMFHCGKFANWEISVTKDLAIIKTTGIVNKLFVTPEECLKMLRHIK